MTLVTKVDHQERSISLRLHTVSIRDQVIGVDNRSKSGNMYHYLRSKKGITRFAGRY